MIFFVDKNGQNRSKPSSSEFVLSSCSASLLCLRKLMIAFPSSGSGVFWGSFGVSCTFDNLTDWS